MRKKKKKIEISKSKQHVWLTHEDIKWYETNEQTGKWWKSSTFKISHTYAIKSWTYKGKTLSEKFLYHLVWSRQYLCEVSKNATIVIVFFLPQENIFFKVTKQNVNSAKIKLEISSEGNKVIKGVWYAYCNICSKKVNRMLLKYKDKLPSTPTVEDLIGNWDILQISTDLLDLLGCIITEKKRTCMLGSMLENI